MRRIPATITLLLACVLPAPAGEAGPVLVPPAWEEWILYYNGFEAPEGKPMRLAEGFAPKGADAPVPLDDTGLIGRAARTDGGAPLTLQHKDLAPHKPLTVSFWWALREDAALTTATSWAVFRGAGRRMVVFNMRGKGKWCALKRPAGVFQVLGFPKMKGGFIADAGFDRRYDLRARKWHHAALVFRGAPRVQAYLDGKLWREITLTGPGLLEEDKLHRLVLGPLYKGQADLLLDEVLILNRALDAGRIREYFVSLWSLHAPGRDPETAGRPPEERSSDPPAVSKTKPPEKSRAPAGGRKKPKAEEAEKAPQEKEETK